LDEDITSDIVRAETLLHEISHVVWWVYNLKDEDDEERTVHTMATGLTQVFRDNPKVLEYIKESLS
jgi:hypothetical protein